MVVREELNGHSMSSSSCKAAGLGPSVKTRAPKEPFTIALKFKINQKQKNIPFIHQAGSASTLPLPLLFGTLIFLHFGALVSTLWTSSCNAAYKNNLSLQLSLIKATGLADRLMHVQMEEAHFISRCSKSPYHDIKFENILVAFVLLGFGALASIISIFVETIIFKCKK